MSDVQKKMAALGETLRAEDPDPAKIKAALSAYRAAREKAEENLAAAQKELREVLTLRQEAILVATGLLK